MSVIRPSTWFTSRATSTSSLGSPWTMLPFVQPREPGSRAVNCWAPRSTGDFAADCRVGRGYGEMAVLVMREQGTPDLLRQIGFDLIEHGDGVRDRGLVVGLMGVFGRAIIGGRE
jgi:hypothetical protein